MIIRDGNNAYGDAAYIKYHVNLGNSGTTGYPGTNRAAVTVGGGAGNNARNDYATIAGGLGNLADGNCSFVGGGCYQIIDSTGSYATIAGGIQNEARGNNAVVAGGGVNKANADSAAICGGVHNDATGQYSTVAGGRDNDATATRASILGGDTNRATGIYSTIGGGEGNQSTSNHAIVGGGYYNKASAYSSTVPGGAENVASGGWSFAAGWKAKAIHQSAFVWSDGTDYYSNNANTFNVRASNGIYFSSTKVHDVAEFMDVLKSDNVGEGEIVSVKANDKLGKSSTGYEDNLIGVVSSKRTTSLFLGNKDANYPDTVKLPIAMLGRVYVKVKNENGQINLGDPITSSSTPGVGMKATKAGQTIGIALESFNGASGEILCYVTLGERNAAKELKELKTRIEELEKQLKELKK